MNKKEFLIVAIATLITVIAWVVFEVLHATSEVKVAPNIQEVIQPIDTEFNLEGI